ncbi:peptidylprolyl isomerase [Wenyingzhuangia sp. IMCC45533]
MAILSKIRDRSGFLIIVIGLAMFSFVVSPKDIIDFFSNKNSDVIGVVNGKEISYKEYATRVETTKAQSGRSNYGAMTIENMVWNQLVSEKIYESKLEEAGVVVGEGEIWEAIIANNEVKNSPQFKDANASFSEDKLKAYVADLQNDKTEQGKARLQGWLNYEKAVKKNLLTQAYNNLINVGLNVSENEAVNDEVLNNSKVSADYVYLPFSSIKDTEVKVTKDEVANYINDNESQFQTEATRNLKVVKFNFQASKEDEQAIKQSLELLLEDKEEYNKITKSTELVKGFESTDNIKEFVDEVGTDLPLVDKFQKESELPTVIKEDVKNSGVGSIVGPYKFSKYYKISRLLDVKKIPDSVKASHILISYAGSRSAQQNVTRTQEEAKKLADSILQVVQKRSKKFGELAENYSADLGSASKKGDLGWFSYNSMVPAFRDYSFENSKGDIGVVKTSFGYHVIKIEDQKDFNNAYKLATISRKIEASEKTENKTFEKAETFASELKKGGDLEALAKEKGYSVSPVNGLKVLDVYVGALGENRSVVRWAFNDETDLNDSKRFDLDEKGYAVVALVAKQEKGLMSAENAFSKVEPILLKEKKAKILKDKMQASNLEEIAKSNNTEVKSFSDVRLSAAMIPGVGIEPGVIGTAYASNKGDVTKEIVGDKGVFAIVTKNVEKPNKEETKVQLKESTNQLKSNVSRSLFSALKEDVEIEDYRASRY